jgi:hypothetical protein
MGMLPEMRSKLLLFAASVFVVTTPATVQAKAGQCSIPGGELVPTEEVARGIAEAILRARLSPEAMAGYVLHIERDERNPRKWLVALRLRELPPNPDGTITEAFGGSGMSMKIDRCTGQVSHVHYIHIR